MQQPTPRLRGLRVIELITLLVIAGLIVAITLPRCTSGHTNPNQPPAANPAAGP